MTTAARLAFTKMNGLGNEIVVVDLRSSKTEMSAAAARAIAAAPRTHFDQMMVLHDAKTQGTDAYVLIFNADGSQSSACGNGTRCIGWLESQRTHRKDVRFETKAGILDVSV